LFCEEVAESWEVSPLVEKAGGAKAYASLSRLADESIPGSRGVIVLPYFSRERTPKSRAVYDAAYGLYRELYEQTKDSMKKSGALAQM
jgi:hypothetical protein